MSERVWNRFLSAADQAGYARSAPQSGPGSVGQHAVLVRVCERTATDIDASTAQRISALTTAAAQAGLPVYELSPTTSGASLFFGSMLVARLITARADTVVLCGDTASGSVRSSAADASSHGYRVIVVEDCVWDEWEASRALSLFDIERQYGRVLASDSILGQLLGRAPGAEGHSHGHSHDHGHGHSHDAAHADGPPVMTALPDAVLAALPTGSTPTATTLHPIHGHVLERAGDSILAAVAEQMTAQFGDEPHVIVTLRADQVTGRRDLERALEQTAGGVLVVGIAYRPAAPAASEPTAAVPQPATAQPSTPAASVPEPVPPTECPECGAMSQRTEPAPPDSSGREILLYVCDECGAAWDA